jgi:hypothetical protein
VPEDRWDRPARYEITPSESFRIVQEALNRDSPVAGF